MIGQQTAVNTRMIASVGAVVERHEHWHDERQGEELRNARRAPRESLLLWCQLLGTMATLVTVIVLLVQLH